MDIRDLKKAIKAKSDELSEMQIRKDKAEKRLTDATRDADLVRLFCSQETTIIGVFKKNIKGIANRSRFSKLGCEE